MVNVALRACCCVFATHLREVDAIITQKLEKAVTYHVYTKQTVCTTRARVCSLPNAKIKLNGRRSFKNVPLAVTQPSSSTRRPQHTGSAWLQNIILHATRQSFPTLRTPPAHRPSTASPRSRPSTDGAALTLLRTPPHPQRTGYQPLGPSAAEPRLSPAARAWHYDTPRYSHTRTIDRPPPHRPARRAGGNARAPPLSVERGRPRCRFYSLPLGGFV